MTTRPAPLPRLLRGLGADGRPLALADHTAVHGPLPPFGRHRPDAALAEEVRRSGLHGRGGAGFPTGRKLSSVGGLDARAAQGRRVVVVNGAEGEPLSQKDQVLLTRAPHLVLDGAAVAAQAVDANRVIVATKASCAGALHAALAERRARRLDRVPPEVAVLPERFIAGEETALVSFLDSGPGLPTFVPPRPYERGVGGRPTLIQNTETVAHLGLVARHGADWFRAVGTPEEPGSTLVTLQGAFRGDGVYEVPRGIRLADLVTLAGGLAAPVQAYLIGGYSGAWLGADDAHDLPLDDPSLAAHGATVGVGVVLALPEAACGVAETARILRYLADETAGQCGPCVHGLAAIAGAADQLARGSAGRDVVERLEAWSWQVTGRGACHHPDGATRMLASALKAFAADVEAHRIGRPCAAAPPRRGPARPKPPRATPR